MNTPMQGGEIIAPEGGTSRGVRNSDVAATLAAWYGCEDIIEREGFVGKVRGLHTGAADGVKEEEDGIVWAAYKCRCCNRRRAPKKKPAKGGGDGV